jgi:hypothetical protein
MTSLGFKKSPSEPAIYTRKNKTSHLRVGVYVDGLVITGADRDDIGVFKKEMTTAFKMSDLGLLRYYLGIEVKKNSDDITLTQGAYALKILEKARLAGFNPRQMPMECQLKLSKNSSVPLVDPTRFRSIVGILRYLVNTRLDLTFDVGYVSRLLSELHEDHMVVVKHILCYVVGMVYWGLHMRKRCGKVMLMGFSDSDFAGDIDNRKVPRVCCSSSTGVQFHGNRPSKTLLHNQAVKKSMWQQRTLLVRHYGCVGYWKNWRVWNRLFLV